MSSGKQFRAKFFDKAGIHISDMKVQMNGFRKIINGGLGDLTLDVPLKFEEAYQNAAMTVFNRVEVYVDNLLLYSGFVAGVIPTMAGGRSSVSVICRGHASRFASLPLKSGSAVRMYTDTTNGLKSSAGASAAAISKILAAIIDRYQAEAVYPIVNYNSTSVAVSAVTWTYILQAKSILYSIDKVMENAPYDWYWRVGADNVFRFLQRSSTPDISLNVKTQVESFQDPQLIDGMINRRYFAYNGSPPADAKVTADTTSSDQYGDWWDFHTDGRYTDVSEVVVANQNLIDAKNKPVRRTVVVVPDSNYDRSKGYDIELIEPGMTVSFTNLPEATATVLPDIFVIASVQYSPNMREAALELETFTDDLAREVARTEMQDIADSTDDGPATYS